jgi:hypothetical protein
LGALGESMQKGWRFVGEICGTSEVTDFFGEILYDVSLPATIAAIRSTLVVCRFSDMHIWYAVWVKA